MGEAEKPCSFFSFVAEWRKSVFCQDLFYLPCLPVLWRLAKANSYLSITKQSPSPDLSNPINSAGFIPIQVVLTLWISQNGKSFPDKVGKLGAAIDFFATTFFGPFSYFFWLDGRVRNSFSFMMSWNLAWHATGFFVCLWNDAFNVRR